MRLKAFLVGLEFAGILAVVGGAFIWSHLRFRWAPWPRLLSVGAMVGLAGPGAFWKLIFTLDDLGIENPSERDTGFFTYVAVWVIFMVILWWVIIKTNPPSPSANQSGGAP